jgi:hypothetical protein
VVIETRGAIDAFVMAVCFDYKLLAVEVLEVLSVICYNGGAKAVWSVVLGDYFADLQINVS